MEVGSALATVLFAAFSLPCLLLLVVAAEAALRLASLALRGDGSSSSYAWPSRNAFLGYRISRPSSSYYYYSDPSSSSAAAGFQDEQLLLPPECLDDRLAVAVYRGSSSDNGADVDCVFCLSRIDEGDEVRELRCRHVFHRACLDAWLLRPRATCPLCRDRLLPTDPPRACGASYSDSPLDDDEIYPEDDDAFSISDPSSTAAAYHHGAALWHL